MHFVGARFSDLRMASTALGAIRARVAVGPGDLAVRPLGSTRYDVPSDDILVAGRFEPDDVEAVVGILEAHGGAILARRPESAAVQDSGPPSAAARPARPPQAQPPRPRGTTPDKRLRRPATLPRDRPAGEPRIRS